MDAVIERQHARLGPSGWGRWSTCPGSVQLIDQMAVDGVLHDNTSIYSAEGTAMHWVREQCLLTGKDAHEYIGQVVSSDGYSFTATPEWARWLQPGIDRLREEGGELLVEVRVNLEAWVPGEFGTCDSAVIPDSDDGLIIIDDFKGGAGVVVPAERNGQLMIYALGLWENVLRHKTKATRFRLRIDQPRAPGAGDQWDCTLDDLLRFAEDEYVPAARRTTDPDAATHASLSACRFCPVGEAGLCGEQTRFVLDLLGLTTDDLTKEFRMPSLETLTPEQRSAVVLNQSLINKWLGQVKVRQLNDALAGRPAPGLKAVATKGDRAWVNEEEAEVFFSSRLPQKDVFVRKLKSPTQMELVAGTRTWAKAQELIHQPEGKPALVPESDKRPALVSALDLLEDLPDEDVSVTETPAEESYEDLI